MIGGSVFLGCDGEEVLGGQYRCDDDVRCHLVGDDVEIDRDDPDGAATQCRSECAVAGWSRLFVDPHGWVDLCPTCTRTYEAGVRLVVTVTNPTDRPRDVTLLSRNGGPLIPTDPELVVTTSATFLDPTATAATTPTMQHLQPASPTDSPFRRPARPFPGMAATYHVGGDRYPFTIHDVLDDSTVVAGMDVRDSTTGAWIPDPRGVQTFLMGTFTRRAGGRWVRSSAPDVGDGHLELGKREFYLDAVEP